MFILFLAELLLLFEIVKYVNSKQIMENIYVAQINGQSIKINGLCY